MLRFISLTVENFGPFKGRQTIDFTNLDGVTIIWGNNGRGKTTLLNIFRYALFGYYKNRSDLNVDLTELANIEAQKDGNYDFKVILTMKKDEINYELTRQCTVRDGIAIPKSNDDYETDIFLKENGSILSMDEREHVLNVIMPSEVSRFFLFDGELLQEYEELLIEDNDVGTKIKESIESILGVPVLINCATDVQSALDNYKTKKNKIAQSNAQTQKIAVQIEEQEAEKREQSADCRRLEKELQEFISERTSLESEMEQNQHINSLLQQKSNLENINEKMTEQETELLSQISVITKDAWKWLVSDRVYIILSKISEELEILEKKESDFKLEQKIVEDMKGVVQSHHCYLCDQDLDDAHVQALIERISMYTNPTRLSEEEQKTIQSLQARKATLETLLSKDSAEVLETLENQLDQLRVKIGDNNRKLKSLQEEIEHFGKAEDLSKKMQETVEAHSLCELKITNHKDGIKAVKEKIKEINNALDTLEKKLNTASTDTDMLHAAKEVSLCEEVFDIFDQGIDAYRNTLKKNVEKDASELFVSISNDPDYVRLQINDNYGLSIVHRSGELVPLRSAGFEHVVALSLIGALHKNAPLRGPIIMDSPFGRLDPEHKRNVIKALPKMSEQIILLVYTHEIDEQQTRESLAGALRREYRLTRLTSFHTEIEPQ